MTSADLKKIFNQKKQKIERKVSKKGIVKENSSRVSKKQLLKNFKHGLKNQNMKMVASIVELVQRIHLIYTMMPFQKIDMIGQEGAKEGNVLN
jgi:hypothetical protein